MAGRSNAACGAVIVVGMLKVSYRLIGRRPSIRFSQRLKSVLAFWVGCIALGLSINATAQLAQTPIDVSTQMSAEGVSESNELRAFGSSTMRSRYYALINELRCPKCQNQNLSDSDAPIAEDLRNELFSLLDEGYSDQEIRDFMTARYGTFVLYQPPLTRFTLALWLLPLGLLLISGLIIWRMTGKPSGLADSSFEHQLNLQKIDAVNAGTEPISMKVDALDRHIAELERTHEHDK